MVSGATDTISIFRDTATRPPSPAPTPSPTVAPTPSNAVPVPSGEGWYERLAVILVGVGVLVVSTGVWVRFLIAKGCCCFAAAIVWRKKRVECPACEKEVEVEPEGLEDRAHCWCDILRAKAVAQARIDPRDNGGGVSKEVGVGAGAVAPEQANGVISELASSFAAEGGAEKVLFHPDPSHIKTCPHCGIVFCVTCDVRDEKRMFPNLFENNPEGSQEETRAADLPDLESGDATKVWKSCAQNCKPYSACF